MTDLSPPPHATFVPPRIPTLEDKVWKRKWRLSCADNLSLLLRKREQGSFVGSLAWLALLPTHNKRLNEPCGGVLVRLESGTCPYDC